MTNPKPKPKREWEKLEHFIISGFASLDVLYQRYCDKPTAANRQEIFDYRVKLTKDIQYLISQLLEKQAKEVVEKELRKLYKAAGELDKHNSEALFHEAKDLLKPEAYMYLTKIIAIAHAELNQ